MIDVKKWPKLEAEFLGEMVRECWKGEYEESSTLKRYLVSFLGKEGPDIDGEHEDNLRGFDAPALFEDKVRWDYSISRVI